MTGLAWWAVQTVATTAAMAVVVALACRLLRPRPAIQHALWVVVLLKLLTPIVLSWPWTADEVASLVRDSLVAGAAQENPQPTSVAPTEIDGWGESFLQAEVSSDLADPITVSSATLPTTQLPAVGNEAHVAEREPNLRAVPTAVSRILPRVGHLLVALWLAGTALTVALQARRLCSVHRLVRGAREAPACLSEEVERLAGSMGVWAVPVLVSEVVASPFLWCLGRVRLLWPARLATDHDVARLRGVIAHELAHVRRRDDWVTWLELAAGVLWWWNPVFWFVRRSVHETANMACDAWAMEVLPERRREYAEILLELSQSVSKTVAPVPVLGVSTGARRTFQRRLAMVLSERVPCKLSWRGLVAVAGLALVTLPGWMAAQEPKPTEPATKASSPPAATAAAAPATGPAAVPATNGKAQRLEQRLRSPMIRE